MRSTRRCAMPSTLCCQADQVLSEAIRTPGGEAEVSRALEDNLPGGKSRGAARLRQ